VRRRQKRRPGSRSRRSARIWRSASRTLEDELQNREEFATLKEAKVLVEDSLMDQ
jgi:hypothetical protein